MSLKKIKENFYEELGMNKYDFFEKVADYIGNFPIIIDGFYFDNTSVYIGKYFGSAIYADAMLHLSYYDPLSAKTDVVRKSVYENLLFQPEIGFEMNTPFFQLRWHIAPSNLDSLFVSDTGLTLSWKFSY